MVGEGPSRPKRRVKQRVSRSPPHPTPVPDFKRVYFPSPSLVKRLHSQFMIRKLTDSFFLNLNDFEELVVCSNNVKEMLVQWENALNLEEKVYPNLVRIFYSNMELSATRLDRLVTYVRGVPIEFTIEDLNSILGTGHAGLKLYTSRKELEFNHFCHVNAVRNICRY